MLQKIYLILCLLIPTELWSSDLYDAALIQERKVKSLSNEQLAGQLIMTRYSTKAEALKLIKEHHIGGFILPEGDPYELRDLVVDLRKASDMPLWIGIESKDGLNPAFTNSITLPNAHTLASISDETLVADYGYSVGKMLSGIGANMHLSVYPLANYKKGMLRSGVSIFTTENLYRSGEVDLKTRIQYPISFKYYQEATGNQILVEELRNGLDLILVSQGEEEVVKTHTLISSELKKKELRKLATKILTYKGQVSTSKVSSGALEKLIYDKNRIATFHDILQKSFVARNGEHTHLPIVNLADNYIASLTIDNKAGQVFRSGLERYTHVEHFEIADSPTSDLLNHVSRFDWVLVDLTSPDLGGNWVGFINDLAEEQYVAAYVNNVGLLGSLSDKVAIIWNYEAVPQAYDLVTQAFFGAIDVNGVLPKDIGAALEWQESNDLNSISRLKYGMPELNGIDSDKLQDIEEIMTDAIQQGATPGGQVMVVKNNTVVYSEAFGYQTYDSITAINTNTLYDIASVSKVAGTLQAVMFLAERNVIDLDDPIHKYFPELEGEPKGEMIIKEILAHQSGLPPYYPFWRKTMDKRREFSDEYYSEQPLAEYDQSVVPGLYMKQGVSDSLWNWIISDDVRLANQPKYRYSDIGFMLLKRLAEQKLNQPLDVFLNQNFYDPMGIDRLAYNPLCIFDRSNIAPTERDHYYRNTTIWGNVHDQNAAFVGGVAGHAHCPR
ncbi:MAG: serine hydrolase [Bacteroidota bacterium]